MRKMRRAISQKKLIRGFKRFDHVLVPSVSKDEARFIAISREYADSLKEINQRGATEAERDMAVKTLIRIGALDKDGNSKDKIVDLY